MFNKLERGFEHLLYVWGADHHGYIARLRAGLVALGGPPECFEVRLVQFVSLFRGGEKAQMSTRSGEFVTLRALREEVGNDAARLFYVMRSNDQHLDFDLELAKARSNDNPVYYIQYAHARVASVQRQMEERGIVHDRGARASPRSAWLVEPQEQQADQAHLRVSLKPSSTAPLKRAPHTLVHYLRDLANDFHTYYSAHQFLVEDAALRDARVSLAFAAQIVIRNGLSLLGVSRARHACRLGDGPRLQAAGASRRVHSPDGSASAAVWLRVSPSAALVYVKDHRPDDLGHASSRSPTKKDRAMPSSRRMRTAPDATAGDDSGELLRFLRMLPKFEVVVPEKEKDVRPDIRAVPETRRGTYVLQAGSYKNFADADRVRAQARPAGRRVKGTEGLRGQRYLAPDPHRTDLEPRSSSIACAPILRKADVDVLVIRVGD